MKAANLDHGFGICEHTELDCDCQQEAWNVWYAEPEPEPITWYEAVVIFGGIWVIGFAAIVIIFVALGYAHVRFFQ